MAAIDKLIVQNLTGAPINNILATLENAVIDKGLSCYTFLDVCKCAISNLGTAIASQIKKFDRVHIGAGRAVFTGSAANAAIRNKNICIARIIWRRNRNTLSAKGIQFNIMRNKRRLDRKYKIT